MDTYLYLNIIANGEGETVEFKKSTRLIREIVETACAFANHKGGYIFVGILDDGSILGQEISDDTLKNLANSIQLNTEPKLYPSIESVSLEGRQCLVVTVEESPLKPHLAYGKAFKRVGATSQKLDREQYEYLLRQRMNGYGFDHQINKAACLDDINTESVYNFLETANSVRSFNENLMLPAEVLLQKLDLATKDGITNAAVLLFGKEPTRFFHNHFEIKCGDFFQNTGYDQLLNEQEFSENLVSNFSDAYVFVVKSIKKTTMKADLKRQEVLEYPPGVLREALVNMIVHRDYRQGIKSTVEIRPSTISFYNPGQLFEPTITIERLAQPHPSRPGNKLIARAFYLLGLFENWGSGTLKILHDSVAEGNKVPKFSFEGSMFRLELFRNG